MTYALPLLWLLLLVEIAGGVARAPYLTWNAVRLARSLEILRGLPLYPGRDALGPIIGTLHTPLSHLFYTPAALLANPTAALLAGSSMAVLAVLLPLAWAVLKGAPHRWAMLCFLFTAFLIIQTPGTYNVLFMIHADAPAVGLATLACGLLLDPQAAKPSRYWLAGCACALSVAAKQTMAPVIMALALYIALDQGVRPMLHFIGATAAGGLLLLAAMLTAWPAHDVLFNIWTLAASRPLKPHPLEILLTAYRTTRLDALPALVPVLVLSAIAWRSGLRDFLSGNRWVVFLLCAIAMLPVSLKAMVTIGSDINHLGVVLYFLFVAAGLAMRKADTKIARVFLAVGILVSLAPGLILGFGHVGDNPSQLAADYNHRHPGRAYFPWNPAATVRDDGRIYHLDGALFDREAVGYPLSAQQLQSGLPTHFAIVALPPGELIVSQVLRDLTANYSAIQDPELPGWTVLAMAH